MADINKVKLSDSNVNYTKTINDNFSELDLKKVEKVDGKGLSTEDFTSDLKTKLEGISAGAEVNVVETVKVNGTALTPDANKAVDVTVPTNTSDLTNDGDGTSAFATVSAVATKVDKVSTASKVYGTDVNGEQTVYDINSFGQVDTVNGVSADNSKNVTIDASDIKLDKSDAQSSTVATTISGIDTRLGTAETKLSGIEAGAQENIIEEVQVNGTALTPDANKAVNVIIPAASEYTIAEQAQAETGYAKTYYLSKDGVQTGAKINIPKDLVVESGEIKVVETADQPYEGAEVGDKYIDLTINDSSADHIYIPVKDLVDIYTAGDGINVSASNEISLVVNNSNANGLSVSANGIALAVATTSSNGAMSSTDKTKLDGIESGAEVNIIEDVKVNGTSLTPDANRAVDVSVPTAIFKNITVGLNTIQASTTTDTVEIEGGNNVTVTADTANKKVTIATANSSYIQTRTFSSADEGWGTADANGNFTLTIVMSGTPIVVKKVSTNGGYESCMADLRSDGTNVYVTADTKFDGQIIYYA